MLFRSGSIWRSEGLFSIWVGTDSLTVPQGSSLGSSSYVLCVLVGPSVLFGQAAYSGAPESFTFRQIVWICFILLDGALSWSCIGLHFIHCESSPRGVRPRLEGKPRSKKKKKTKRTGSGKGTLVSQHLSPCAAGNTAVTSLNLTACYK